MTAKFPSSISLEGTCNLANLKEMFQGFFRAGKELLRRSGANLCSVREAKQKNMVNTRFRHFT